MQIRREQEQERASVETMIRNAFWNIHTPGASEHYLAHCMRAHEDFVEELNMVALIDNKIVGSIMYTVAKLTSEDGEAKECLTFGPLAVDPDYQRRGIGKALIEKTFEKAVEMGYESVVIFGHPSNYVERGFVSCKRVNVCIGEDYFPTAMLVKVLAGSPFDGKRWYFEESAVYNIDPEEAEQYDKLFPPKEKKVLPCQEEFYIYSHSTIHN